MSFVSIEFLVLLLALLGLLAVFRQPLIRKLILLSASCIFYAWWDWRFLGLLLVAILFDYYISRLMVATTDAKRRNALLWLSIVINLGVLGFFKYFNFFIDNLNVITGLLGW